MLLATVADKELNAKLWILNYRTTNILTNYWLFTLLPLLSVIVTFPMITRIFFSEIIETTTLLSAFRKWFWETRNKESRKPKCFLLCHYNNLIHFFFGAETNADKTSWVVSFYFIFQSIFHHRAFSCVFCSFIVFKIYTYNTTTDPDNIYIVISLLSYTLCHLIFCFVHSHFCSCILLNVSRTF